MNVLDVFFHAAGFFGPALFCAALSSAVLRWWGGDRYAVSWWRLTQRSALAGVAALALGWLITGRDGRMISYAGMVLAVAFTLAASGNTPRKELL